MNEIVTADPESTGRRSLRAPLLCVLALLVAGDALAQNLTIYDDALQNGFLDYSYGAPPDFASTAQVHDGTKSIAFTGNAYNAVSFARPATPVTTAQYPTLRFWVHGGAVGSQQLRVHLQNGGIDVANAELDTYIAGGALAAGVWREVTITLGSAPLSYSGTFDRIDLQSDIDGLQGVLYIDDVVLIPPAPQGPANTMQIEHGVMVVSMASDRFTWVDSSGQPRVASLAHNNGQVGPGGGRGGSLREFRYQLPNGAQRVAGLTGFAPGNGFERVFEGRHHAIFRFRQNYPRNCDTSASPVARTLPVTIDWVFTTGHDNPLWAITYDIDLASPAAPANTFWDDSRAPYGELAIDGEGFTAIGGVAWGDRFKFTTTSAPATLNSTWDWTAANTVPYVKEWLTGPLSGTNTLDATMGIVQTQTMSQQDAVGGRDAAVGTDVHVFWGTTSVAGNACVALKMPCANDWPYQANANSLGAAAGSNNARLTWKTQFGFLGQTTYTVNDGVVATAPGYPKKSYSTYIVLGTHTSGPVEAQVTQVETVQSVTFDSILIGSVKTGGAAGVTRADAVTYSPAGYNHVYGALAFDASGNRLDLDIAVGAGTLKKPLMIVSNYTADYPTVKMGGATLVADVDYFASLRPAASELWITLNRDVTGAANHLEIAATLAIDTTPTITMQPADQAASAGANATLIVVASGNPTPTYQWQVSTNGGTSWADLTNTAPYSGATTTTLIMTAVTASQHGNQYRAVATNSVGTATSAAATLTVNVGPAITTQPANQTVTAGQNAQLTVGASGNPTPTYQWQVSTNGGTSWADLTNGTYSGVTSATLTLTSSTAGLNAYQYRCVATNSAASVTSSVATLTVYGPASLTPTALRFAATKTAASSTFTTVTSAQVVTVTFAGAASAWTASADQTWVQITSSSASGNGQFTVSLVNPSNVIGASTALSATITVTAATASNSPIRLPVTVTVSAPGSTTAPFGSFDTPAAGVVQGSIAVTGWALDDIAIDRVEIWRDLVAGETTVPFNAPGHPGHGKVYIATPLFVAGSRPDVEAAFPTHPFANRAGWGYLLLTWGLWNQGNGAVTLHAFAFDQEGNATTLGTKTVTADNANATKPFGALDVPAYGETKSALFFNFGWALTPNANLIDGRTCTITNGNVFAGIDSGALATVDYGDNRTDIAGFFPGFSNGSSGGGHYLVDTTTMTNGVHQIGWSVVDSCGRADGIGSRFFTVLNGSSGDSGLGARDLGLGARDPLPADAPRVAQDSGPAAPAGAAQVAPHVVHDSSPAVPTGAPQVARDVVQDLSPAVPAVRRTIGEWMDIPPDAAGVHVVAIEQSERIEVRLPALDDAVYSGAQVVNGEQRALPLGSSLDAEAGTLYWQPAAGFLGSFDLMFTAGGAETKVRVVVLPSMRMAIDMPSSAAIVQQPFTVAGWALDLAATDGAGIDTVHVWAYPAAGGDPTLRPFEGLKAVPSLVEGRQAQSRPEQGRGPIFLGVADSVDSRPDVAATYGQQFGRSSFNLVASGLPPGTYDVVVYAHRASTGAFDAAQSVRVTVR